MRLWIERLEILADILVFLSVTAIGAMTLVEVFDICDSESLSLMCPPVINLPIQVLHGVALMLLFGGFFVVLPMFLFSIISKTYRFVTARSFFISDMSKKGWQVLVFVIASGTLLFMVG